MRTLSIDFGETIEEGPTKASYKVAFRLQDTAARGSWFARWSCWAPSRERRPSITKVAATTRRLRLRAASYDVSFGRHNTANRCSIGRNDGFAGDTIILAPGRPTAKLLRPTVSRHPESSVGIYLGSRADRLYMSR